MSKVSWIQNDSTYRRIEGDISNIEKISNGIYTINIDRSGWYLEKYADKFTFNYKIYGLEHKFMEHVLKAYHNTSGNFGVLMNGTKGTGKSVTAKLLANNFNIPVIIVKSFGEQNNGLIEYIASFNFDCVLFFDEFEKNFKREDSSILQIMDGAYNSEYRKIFLLTTNETYINENLLSRPSRLRYVRQFGNLEKEIALEYINDNLNDKSGADRLLDYVGTLEISTIDILKTIVEDVNIFGIDEFLKTKDYFNVRIMHFNYDLTYCVMNLSDVKKSNYGITEFLNDIAKSEVPYPREYDFKTHNDFLEACRLHKNKYGTKADIQNEFQTSNKCIKDLVVGDSFINPWNNIIKIDFANHVIVCIDEDSVVYFYKVNNPNTKPSLYSSKDFGLIL